MDRLTVVVVRRVVGVAARAVVATVTGAAVITVSETMYTVVVVVWTAAGTRRGGADLLARWGTNRAASCTDAGEASIRAAVVAGRDSCCRDINGSSKAPPESSAGSSQRTPARFSSRTPPFPLEAAP